jgi:hypothetical protein
LPEQERSSPRRVSLNPVGKNAVIMPKQSQERLALALLACGLVVIGVNLIVFASIPGLLLVNGVTFAFVLGTLIYRLIRQRED